MVNDVINVITDTVNKINECLKPKEYIAFCYESYSPMNGSLYTVHYLTEKELKQFIEKHHAKDIYIFKPEDSIKYNIDITIEDDENDERYGD